MEHVAKAEPGVVSVQMATNFYQPEETETYHPRYRLLVHVELIEHTVWHACLILELRSQPCSRQCLACRLAVRPSIGPHTGHHVHLETQEKAKRKQYKL